MNTEASRPIYLDHNATTPVAPEVVEAMLPFLTADFGNPASVEHVYGNIAQEAVAQARKQVASSLGARDNEIIFTSGCTEANNIALLGAARARPDRKHLVASVIEHPAVLEPLAHLAKEGFEVSLVPVDADGKVDPCAIESAIRPDTGVVSVMGANNEVGTIQPIREIGAICAEQDVWFHSDLAQLMAHRAVDVVECGLHLASVSAHKAYGPKGVGALYVRSRSPRVRIEPVMFGGGQERGLRAGTVPTHLVVGLGKALAVAQNLRDTDNQRLEKMQQMLVRIFRDEIAEFSINGDTEHRLPNNLSLSIAGVEPLALIHRLNSVASFSASSACATGKVETSHVLQAMFGDSERARGAFRISPGRYTTEAELETFADALIAAIADLRRYAA
mgnify:CR=1 FL=1|jgi:cysteine desulfurase|tara:strand:- start:12218 stop:13387 length:1170 start_codon:yes stop_codon:yes gene_type:complete